MSETTRQTSERILAEMRELAKGGDAESDHGRADDLLCEMLNKLGYSEIVLAFHQVEKWYA